MSLDIVSLDAVLAAALEVLNRALKVDRLAITDLMETRVPCSEKLRKDPTIQVVRKSFHKDSFVEVGPLGLINGIFGIRDDGAGHITAVYDEESRIIRRFELTQARGKG